MFMCVYVCAYCTLKWQHVNQHGIMSRVKASCVTQENGWKWHMSYF